MKGSALLKSLRLGVPYWMLITEMGEKKLCPMPGKSPKKSRRASNSARMN